VCATRTKNGVIVDTAGTCVVRWPVYFFEQWGLGHALRAVERQGGAWAFPPARSGLEGAAMNIDERVVDGVTILDLKGKMTLGEGDELLKDKINSLIQQDRKKLLLNLEGVPYIDSAGLGEIVRTYTTVSRQGGKLKLLNLTKRIQDLLAITKLLTVFETYESEPDALKSFGS
jgi:anti-sigma B factor antagonist